MRLKFIFSCIFIFTLAANAQINLSDSTVKAIAYWEKGDKQSYAVTSESYKINNEDTTNHQIIRYKIDVNIIDSTANAYVMDFHYHSYKVEGDEMLAKIMNKLSTDLTVRVKTDEFGTFQEVINWKEVQKRVIQAIDVVKNELKEIPNLDLLIENFKKIYNSKEAIETTAITDIQLFLAFFGVEYKFDSEISSSIQMPNGLGGEPFDTDVVIWLDEIDPEENDYLIRMNRVTNSTQLTKATFEYINTMAETLGGQKIKFEDFPLVMNNVWTASRIHGSGWVLQAIETKETVSHGITQINELSITLE
jgi:hypothetical protein